MDVSKPKLIDSMKQGGIGEYGQPTEFHVRLAARYANIVGDSRNSNQGHVEIYIPEGFGGDWSGISAEDYYLHLLSVLGSIPPDGEVVSAGFIMRELFLYSERIKSCEGVILEIQNAYADFNADLTDYGISVGTFDKNDIIFVDRKRLIQLYKKGGKTCSAVYFRSRLGGEILVPLSPNGDIPSNLAYSLITHELGHKARDANDLDGDEEWWEEGCVELESQYLQTVYKKEVIFPTYKIETLFTQALAKKLRIEKPIAYSVLKIQLMTDNLYGYEDDESPSFYELCEEVENIAAEYEELQISLWTSSHPKEVYEANDLLEKRIKTVFDRFDFDNSIWEDRTPLLP